MGKGLKHKARSSPTRKDYGREVNSIARKGSRGGLRPFSSAPCGVQRRRLWWGLGQRPNCSSSNQFKGNSQQRAQAANGHVYAATETDEFLLRQRLWELEERLDSHHFIRISNSEIINLRRVIAFDLSLTGTICVSLQGGQISYVSRRYVRTIRQALGL